MSYKTHPLVNLKLILLCFFILFLVLFLVIRSDMISNISAQQAKLSNEIIKYEDAPSSPLCQTSTLTTPSSTHNKIAPSLAEALIHYATSNTTPQQTFKEISVSSRVLERKSPCNFLIFGLGLDSLMWTSLNYGGRTVFLEEDKAWIDQIKSKLPTLEAYHVVYHTKVHQADQLLEMGMKQNCKVVSDPRFSKCELALKPFPSEVYDIDWDLIMVDAPTGYFEGAPGRMGAIYTAGLMARNRKSGETDVFVHDVDRKVEDQFSKSFLCEGYLNKQQGRLRHFIVPSHRTHFEMPFCP